jgi:NAD-dependent deacetylase
VVLFGETLPATVLAEAVEAVAASDLVLVVGSSLVVEPAASLPLHGVRHGARLAIVNLDPTPLDPHACLVIHDPADEVLPAALALLRPGRT